MSSQLVHLQPSSSSLHRPSMANPRPESVAVSVFLLLLLLFAAASGATPTAYEVLESFDFPVGVLPQGVSSYLLREDGSFEVYLGDLLEDCTFKIAAGYQLDYKRRITGRVENGAIHGLTGVSVKILFVWLGITDVVREGDDLKFFVGPLSASFAADGFDESPRCGCGFDCPTAAAADQ